jgi:glyoxylase-like metal-dependent hydrolase (beta-lactamase superfamily II)
MVTTYSAARDIDVLTTDYPIPGFGLLAINAFVLHGPEPILVDTGLVGQAADYLAALRSIIDPQELRWIWLTHTDFDHIGALQTLLAENPRLRVITTYLGVGIMSLTAAPLPLDRVHLLNPGQKVTLGGRALTAVKPPVFDNPSTTGFYDEGSRTLFSSDCFGALLPAIPRSAADLSDRDLREGQVIWATVDAPWLHKVDRGVFSAELESIRSMEPRLILSSHLPAAPGHMLDRLLASLAAAPEASPFTGPDQAALEQMLEQMTGPAPSPAPSAAS